MTGKILSIITAVILISHPLSQSLDPNILAVLMMVLMTALSLVFPIVCAGIWMPLLTTEQSTSPHIIELYNQDRVIRSARVFIVALPIITFAMILDLMFLKSIDKVWSIAAWIVLWGISFDALFSLTKQVTSYLDPFLVVKLFTKHAKIAIQNNHEADLCTWIDALSETTSKGIQARRGSLCIETINELQSVVSMFFDAYKSIAHREQDAESKALGIDNKVNFTLVFIYQRLEMIFNRAIESNTDLVCISLLNNLGKIIISAAKYDISMTPNPTHLLVESALKAQAGGREKIAVIGSFTLLEAASTILKEVDLQYCSILEPFLAMINGILSITKNSFQKDKTTNILLLAKPFMDLKLAFNDPKVKDHPDTAAIVDYLDRIVGEFDALRLVMATMPKQRSEEDIIIKEEELQTSGF